MNPLFRTLENLLFPPRCAACRTLLPPVPTAQGTFCPACEKEWARVLCLQCPTCFSDYPDCRCQPSVLKRAGSKALVKLAPYGDSAREHVVKNIVIGLKKRPGRQIAAHLCKELAESVRAALKEADCAQSELVVAHLPRDKKRLLRDGADQSAVLARALAHELGVEHLPLLYRIGSARAQKTLSARERMQNLSGAFGVREIPQGKCILLLDDVVTTGASLAAAVEALRKAGAGDILCVCVAQTQRKH